MRHVLLLLEYPTLNGGEQSLLAVVPHLLRAGFQLTAACPAQGPLAAALSQHGIACVDWQATGSLAQRRQQLHQLLKDRPPQLVHANSLSMTRLAAPVARQLDLPLLGHLRDIMRLRRQAVADLNQADRLLAVSHATYDNYLSQGVDPARLFVLYNGVDLQRFYPQRDTGQLRRELGLGTDSPLLGMIGQIGMRKGTDLLLQAVQPLAARLDLHCLLIGQRHSNKAEALAFEQDLHQRAAAAPLAGRVHFLGRRSDVPQLLSQLTLLVHPARQEPLGRVLLEAAAAGCCVVATRVGGTAEIFPPDSGAACLIPPEDVNALTDSLQSLLTDPAQRERFAAAARRRAEVVFDARQAARRLIQHYNQLLPLP